MPRHKGKPVVVERYDANLDCPERRHSADDANIMFVVCRQEDGMGRLEAHTPGGVYPVDLVTILFNHKPDSEKVEDLE